MNAFAEVWKAAWDTETTGPDPLVDRIVSAAFIVRAPGQPDRTFPYLINPGVPIPKDASGIHGIDDAKVQAEGQDPKTALDELASHLVAALTRGMPLIAFNQSFDWSILHYDLIRNGLPTVEERLGRDPLTLLDPHVIDRQCVQRLRGKGMRKLKPTAERYGVVLKDWHEAKADALAALLIAEAQFVKYPQLNSYGPQQLFAAQKAWRAEQQAGLQQWFRTKASAEQGGDPNKVIDGSWPLIPAQRGGES